MKVKTKKKFRKGQWVTVRKRARRLLEKHGISLSHNQDCLLGGRFKIEEYGEMDVGIDGWWVPIRALEQPTR